MTDLVRMQVNGAAVEFDGDPRTRLLDVIRERLSLTGTKEGCGEGECGACAVLIDGEVVCSCLVPVFQVDGSDITTIESLAPPDALLPLQQTFVDAGGVQCGACTPGIVLTLHALFQREPRARRARVREALAGNLCRCTGYERILRAAEEHAARLRGDVS